MHLSYIRASRRLYVLAAALLLAAPPLFGTPLLLTKVSLAAFVLMLSGLLFALGGGVGKFFELQGSRRALLAWLLPALYAAVVFAQGRFGLVFVSESAGADSVVFWMIAAVAFMLGSALFRTPRALHLLRFGLYAGLSAGILLWLLSAFGIGQAPFVFSANPAAYSGLLLLLVMIAGALYGFASRAELASAPQERPRAGRWLVLALLFVFIATLLINSFFMVRRFSSEVGVAHVHQQLQEGRVGQAFATAAHAANVEHNVSTLAAVIESGAAYLLVLSKDSKLSGEALAKEFDTVLAPMALSAQLWSARDPQDYRPHYAMAQVYGFLAGLGVKNAADSARAAYGAAAARAPRNPDIPLALGRFEITLGRLPAAQAAILVSLHLKPDYVQAKYSLGFVYAAQGRTADALKQFEDLLKQYPGNREIGNIVSNLNGGRPSGATPGMWNSPSL